MVELLVDQRWLTQCIGYHELVAWTEGGRAGWKLDIYVTGRVVLLFISWSFDAFGESVLTDVNTVYERRRI